MSDEPQFAEEKIRMEQDILRWEMVREFGKKPKFRLFYAAEKHRLRPSAIASLKARNANHERKG